ncbi:MAG: hypothetical protein FJZ00_14475 [Candidatus Sericytochromatia bacterium]|uniref:Uncharacterized protein n=1 Tax=Candidatus Tanganyikabacteria bacterium TaxID=2961651 RepID=A0A937X5B5_9BACT|nr:hypothetical protein [Candidatus Tanganyikabacteria bacterium]
MKSLNALHRPAAALIAVFGLAVGCSLMPDRGEGTAPAGTAALSLVPDIRGGGIRTQALLTPYASSDINHLAIKLFRVVGAQEVAVLDAGGQQVAVDVPRASLGGSAVIGNLAFDTTYRVKAFAYATAGTANLISTTDSRSWVDVQVQRDDRPTLATVPVQLIDRVFSGEATASSIAVSSGSLSHSGSESLVAAPVPTPTP